MQHAIANKNTLYSVAQSLSGILAIFATFKILILHHGQDALGLWSLVVGVTAFARLADLSGASAAVRLVAIAEANGDRVRSAQTIDTLTLLTTTFYVVIIAAAYVPCAYALAAIVEPEMSDRAQELLPLTFVALALGVIGATWTGALDGAQRIDLRALTHITSQMVLVALAVVLIPKFGVIGLAIAQLGQFSATLAISRTALVRIMPELSIAPVHWSGAIVREAVSYGARVQISSVAALAYDPLMRVIVNQFGGISTLALYELAYRLVSQARAFVTAAATPLVPRFAGEDASSAAPPVALICQANDAFAAISSVLIGGACLASPIVGWAMLGVWNEDFVLFAIVLGAGYLANSFGVTMYLYAQAVGVLRWNILGQFAIAIVAVGLGAAAGARSGGEASVIGTAAGLAIGSLAAMWANVRWFGLALGDLFSTKWTILSLVLFVGCAIVAQIVNYQFAN